MPAALDEAQLPVPTAVANPSVEAALVAGFSRHDLGFTVVRRCVDLVELLAAASTGTAKAALVSADLCGLDRESLVHLAGCGLATVGLAADEAGERQLHQLGAGLVLAFGAAPEQVAGALRAAGAALPAPGASRRQLPDRSLLGTTSSRLSHVEPQLGLGTVIAVWGPTGAPGRTTLALGLADAMAQRQHSTLLIDADSYGGAIATLTGLLDESPAITAACRAANAGTLDVPRLAEYCRELSSGLRVLTGLAQASRWPELRPAALEVVLGLSRHLADVTVVDCGFSLEDDEELAYDTLAPRRNAATLTSPRAADRIVAVAGADPIGRSRLARELAGLAAALGEPLEELSARGHLVIVANRLRTGLLPGNPERAVMEALERHAGVAPYATLPMDMTAADAAHGSGRLLSEAAPESPLFLAMAGLAGDLTALEGLSTPAPKAGRRRHLGRRRSAGAVS